jgi:YVTN family beta-propeller protein
MNTTSRAVALLVLGLILASSGASSSFAQKRDLPVRAVSDAGVITTRQEITPAGVQTVFDERVYGANFGKDGDLWVLTRSRLYQLNWLDNQVKSVHPIGGAAGIRGLAMDPQSGRPTISAIISKSGSPSEVRILMPDEAGGAWTRIGGALGANAAGSPVWSEGRILTPLLFDDKLAIVDPATGRSVDVAVGVAPVAVVASGSFAYVANWGGEKAAAGEASAPTGTDPLADRVRIDAKGVAKAGTVSVVDLSRSRVVATIPVGRHPTALALDAGRGILYVTNTNDDSVSLIDLKSRRVLRTIKLQPFGQQADGIAPTAVAFDKQRNRLYIACGGINAIAVYDLATQRISGLIPTGWYPVSVSLDGAGDRLAAGTLLGVGSGQRDGLTKRYVHANRGTVHVIAIPDAAQLASYTAAVRENNRLPFVGAQDVKPNRKAAAKAVPVRAGEPSLIEHVVFIVKENRTYDQVFGDLERGNGDPSLVMFGEDITPNQHRLAREFVVLDNFYATGGNSADGHQWVTQANEPSYTLWPGYEGRSYPYDGSDPLAYSARGFIWDAALSQKKTVAVFGEYAPHVTGGQRSRLDLLKAWQSGEVFNGRWDTRSPIPPLDGVLVREYPSYSTAIPDVIRAQIFNAKLREYSAAGKMPNLVIVQLPSNHTNGTSPNQTTAKAMVADNDLAVGQVVEALTQSPFWPKMAIFVVEDDAQNGVDHVDGHRTVALAISPYVRRRSVDSTFYAHQSILKTIELMLGLPTLSLFDLIAMDMRASFQDTADLTPYQAVTPRQDLLQLNPPLQSLNGPQLQGALASAAMRWDVPDAVPSAVLNQISWHDVKGWDTPYPEAMHAVFSPFQLEDDDQDNVENDDSGDSDKD